MTLMIRRIAATTLLAAASVAFARPAPEVQTNVDVELGPAADVRGTLAGETDVFRFTAPAEAKLTFRVTATPARSLRFDVQLLAPDATEVPIADAPRYVNRRGVASLTGFALPAAGRYTLRLGGTGSGTYRLTWTTGPAAGKAQKLDVRCAPLGRAPGDETAVCRTMPAATPLWIDVADASDLAGTRLLLWSDAAPAGSSVLLRSATAPVVPDAATRQAAGPAIDVAPSGVVLASPATLTMRYDPFFLPRGADATDLVVARVETDGTAVSLVPSAVDTFSHTVTVATDRLARFVVSAPKGPLDPTGRTYWRASFDVSFTPKADSRDRDVLLRFGRSTFSAGGALPGQGEVWEGPWSHDDAGVCNAVIWGDQSKPDSSSWTLAPDGHRIQVTDQRAGTSSFEISENGQALVGQLEGRTALMSSRIDVALLRSERSPTMKELAGTYWVGVSELDMTWGRPLPLGLEVGRTFATLTLGANGTWTLAADARYTQFKPRGTNLSRDAFSGTVGGRWSVVGAGKGWAEGSVMLTAPGPVDTFVIRVLPSADGRSFVGASEAGQGSFLFLFGVRKSSSLTYASATGDFAATQFELAATTYRVPTTGIPRHTVPDVRLSQTDAWMRFDGSRTLDVTSGAHKSVERDPDLVDGVLVDSETDAAQPSVPFTLTRTGSMTVSVEPGVRVVGAMASDAASGFAVFSPGAIDGSYGLRVFVKSPPR